MEVTETTLREDLYRSVDKIKSFAELQKASILVTGATGLIGSQIVKTLLLLNDLHGAEVYVLACVRNREKAHKIYGELLERRDLCLIVADITNKTEIAENVDFIIHSASVTTSKTMIERPIETICTAIAGTRNMLELAKEKHVRKFLYLSSMEVYGAFYEENIEIDETKMGYIDPLSVRSNYPESKRMCENLCVAYNREYGVPIVIARLAQTFGAGVLAGENRVFAQFARSIMNQKDIVLHTEGRTEGNYCYLGDAICALMLLLNSGKTGEAYNVVNEEMHISIREMAELVCRLYGEGKSRVRFDIPSSNLYGYAQETKMKLTSKKLQNLGWTPEIGLEEAYRRLIEYLRECE